MTARLLMPAVTYNKGSYCLTIMLFMICDTYIWNVSSTFAAIAFIGILFLNNVDRVGEDTECHSFVNLQNGSFCLKEVLADFQIFSRDKA